MSVCYGTLVPLGSELGTVPTVTAYNGDSAKGLIIFAYYAYYSTVTERGQYPSSKPCGWDCDSTPEPRTNPEIQNWFKPGFLRTQFFNTTADDIHPALPFMRNIP